MVTPVTEAQRRDELRALLIRSRSRLTPGDVGLPQTQRRRVAGLRRGEVAELAGVSSDWYRSFESGRPIQVSAGFLSRLAQALRLSPLEQRTLLDLGLAGISTRPLPLLSPIQSLDEVDSVVRELADARDRFLSDSLSQLPEVRPRIVNSWRRSRMLGADPRRKTVPEAASWSKNNALLEASASTVLNLKALLADSGYAVVMADKFGCIQHVAGDAATLRALSRINFERGGDLSEAACGTNAVGTVLTDGRALQVVGSENFCEGGSDLTCAGAPIRDPATLEIIGVLDVTANYRRIHPEILSVVAESALEIEERLLN